MISDSRRMPNRRLDPEVERKRIPPDDLTGSVWSGNRVQPGHTVATLDVSSSGRRQTESFLNAGHPAARSTCLRVGWLG